MRPIIIFIADKEKPGDQITSYCIIPNEGQDATAIKKTAEEACKKARTSCEFKNPSYQEIVTAVTVALKDIATVTHYDTIFLPNEYIAS